MAATVCPPPTIENAFELATKLNISSVPFLNRGFSKTPQGPDKKTVFAFFKISLNFPVVFSPMSNKLCSVGNSLRAISFLFSFQVILPGFHLAIYLPENFEHMKLTNHCLYNN